MEAHNSYSYNKFTTSRKLTYSYIHILPQTSSSNAGPKKGYILFLHGFPSSSYDWHHQIAHFSANGYGLIVPDLLGYGESDKPREGSFYTGKGMASDIAEILEHESIREVVGVGHDWGSYLLSRMYNYYSHLFTHLAFLDIGYSSPGHNLTEQNVRFVNSMVKQTKGYEVFGYFLFFQEEDAVALMDANSDSVQSLFHNKDEEIGKKYMGAEGGMRTWLSENRIAPAPPYMSSPDQDYNRTFYSKDGYGASINWYLAQLTDLNAEDDKAISPENRTLKCPTLLLESDNFITATADFAKQMIGCVEDGMFTARKLEGAGHWLMLERPVVVNQMLDEFLA